MKTQNLEVHNYIYDIFNERGMKNFERAIHTLLKRKGITGNVICLNAYMKRANGRGSYYKIAEIEVNGITYTLKQHTNDSEAWDFWDEPTPRDKRNLFFAVVESRLTELYLETEKAKEKNLN